MSTNYINQEGRAVTLGTRIAGGGEGDIVEVVGRPKLVAKTFHPPKPGGEAKHLVKQAKVRAMVASKPADRTDGSFVVLAWPEELLLDSQRQVAGFLMPKLDLSSSIELHNLTNASDRVELAGHALRGWVSVFTYSHLINVARNLVRAVRVVHRGNKGGHGVIGDFNESNVLVWNTTGVTLVDCDSMQYSLGGTNYLTTVLKPDYSAPEILDGTIDIQTDVRSVETDLYVLALHIYTLLMDGASPFGRGLWKGNGERPDRITLMKNGDWAGGKSRKFVTAPACPPVEMLPTRVRNLFEQTFGSTGARIPSRRATCDDWEDALDELAQRLRTCRLNKLHQWPNTTSQCPWCALEKRAVTQTHLAPPTPARPTAKTPPTILPAASRLQPTPPAVKPASATPLSGPRPTPRPRFKDLFRGREPAAAMRRASAATFAAAALGMLLFATAMLPGMFSDSLQPASRITATLPVFALWQFTPTAFVWGGVIACIGRRFLLLPAVAAIHAILLGRSFYGDASGLWEHTTIHGLYPPIRAWDWLLAGLNSLWSLLPLIVVIALVGGIGGLALAVHRTPEIPPSARAYNSRVVRGVLKTIGTSRRDRTIAIVALVVAGTGLVPWLIGLAMTDHWWQHRQAGVFDPGRRDGWTYFGVRYGSGLVVILVLLSLAWLISGRWTSRVGVIAAAAAAAALGTLVVRPAVAQAWNDAEAITSTQQRTSAGNIAENLLCASKSRTLTDPDTGLASLWQAYIFKSGVNTKCDRFAIFEGIRLAKEESLGSRRLKTKTLMITSDFSLAAAYVRVKDDRGKTRSYKLIALR